MNFLLTFHRNQLTLIQTLTTVSHDLIFFDCHMARLLSISASPPGLIDLKRSVSLVWVKSF